MAQLLSMLIFLEENLGSAPSSSQPAVTPVPGDLMPSSAQGAHKHMKTHMYT